MASIYLSSLALNQKINLCKQDTDSCVHIVIFLGLVYLQYLSGGALNDIFFFTWPQIPGGTRAHD